MTAGARGLVLVGYRGTGKSTVGRIIADRLGRPFADADREIEAMEGRSVGEIFAEEGEAAFRRVESQVIQGLAARLDGGIIATGGGSILDEANRRALRSFGLVAWLKADPDTLASRLSHSRAGLAVRPALTAAGTLGEIAGVLAARTPIYREVADVEIETSGRSAREVARAVMDAWPGGDGA